MKRRPRSCRGKTRPPWPSTQLPTPQPPTSHTSRSSRWPPHPRNRPTRAFWRPTCRRGATRCGPQNNPSPLAFRSRNLRSTRLPPENQDVLVSDVRDVRPRVPVRPQPGPGLVPDHVALHGEPGPRGAFRQVRTREDVAALLVSVSNYHRRIPVGPEGACQQSEDRLHAVEEGRVIGAVGQIAFVLGDHGVVGAPVGVALGELSTGHGERQLDVVATTTRLTDSGSEIRAIWNPARSSN